MGYIMLTHIMTKPYGRLTWEWWDYVKIVVSASFPPWSRIFIDDLRIFLESQVVCPAASTLSIFLTGYGPWSALISFGTSLLLLLIEKDLTGLLVGLTTVSLKSWPFGVTPRPVVDRVDLSLESPHTYRIFCFISDAMAHGWLGWSTVHFLLHLLPKLSWLLWW